MYWSFKFKTLKTLQEAQQHVSIFYNIIFREFFIYFLVDISIFYDIIFRELFIYFLVDVADILISATSTRK
jgi:hypothetical protein